MERRRFLEHATLWAVTAAGTAATGCAPQGAGGTEPAKLPSVPRDNPLPDRGHANQ